MKTILLAAVVAALSSAAYADPPKCKSGAAEKQLAGAALTSFMKKCQRDATASCEAESKEKKLAGAAKTSHMKKCVQDAMGT